MPVDEFDRQAQQESVSIGKKLISELKSGDLFELTKKMILIPFTGKMAVVARDLVKDEIKKQDLIKTGRYLNSIVATMDAEDLSFEVFCAPEDYEGMFFYPFVLEYGSIKMHARYPFLIATDEFGKLLNSNILLKDIEK